jgi:hypothetical protein
MKSHIKTIRNSWSYGITFSWVPNGTKVLTRVPMLGKPLPLNNNTSSSNKNVMCR